MEVYLLVNGHELRAPVDEQERIVLDLAAGQLSRDAFLEWVKQHIASA
jgi:death-on-curing protein